MSAPICGSVLGHSCAGTSAPWRAWGNLRDQPRRPCVHCKLRAAAMPWRGPRSTLGLGQAPHERAGLCHRASVGPLVLLKPLSPRAKTHIALDLAPAGSAGKNPLAHRAWPQTRRELANLADQTQADIIVTKSGNLKVLQWPTAPLGPHCGLASTLDRTMGCADLVLKMARAGAYQHRIIRASSRSHEIIRPRRLVLRRPR